MSDESNSKDEVLPKGFSSEESPSPVNDKVHLEETALVPEPSERERMYEFFKGKTRRVSEIILAGNCPKCFDSGRTSHWVFGRAGGKKCPACGWQD